VFIEAKGDGSGGDNWTTGAISRAKLPPVKSSPPTNQHPVFCHASHQPSDASTPGIIPEIPTF